MARILERKLFTKDEKDDGKERYSFLSAEETRQDSVGLCVFVRVGIIGDGTCYRGTEVILSPLR
jgi:hypothetical protein